MASRMSFSVGTGRKWRDESMRSSRTAPTKVSASPMRAAALLEADLPAERMSPVPYHRSLRQCRTSRGGGR
eukprot:1697432-Rhodomonas_salina.4